MPSFVLLNQNTTLLIEYFTIYLDNLAINLLSLSTFKSFDRFRSFANYYTFSAYCAHYVHEMKSKK